MFMLHHFRRQADDLEEAALAQLAGDGAEDAGALGVLVFLVDDDHRVAIEPHVAAVVAPRRLLDADDHALDDVARLDVAAGDRLLDAGHNDVPDAGVAAPRAAQHLDTHAFLGAGVVSDVQVRVLLNHPSTFLPSPTPL